MFYMNGLIELNNRFDESHKKMKTKKLKNVLQFKILFETIKAVETIYKFFKVAKYKI